MKAIYTRIYPRLPIYKLYTPNQRILTYFSLKPIPLNIYLTFKETVGVIWIYLFKETVGVIWIYLFKETVCVIWIYLFKETVGVIWIYLF